MKNINLIFLITLLILSDISLGAIEPAQIDVSGQIYVKKSALKFNKKTNTYDTTITLENRSNIDISGPLSVYVNVIDTPSVTVANPTELSANGYKINILPSNKTININESIKGTVLKLSNPDNVEFNFSTAVFGVVTSNNAANISSLQPSNGYSSTLVNIGGSGFTKKSIIKFGKKIIKSFTYVSPQEIQFLVPLNIISNRMVPMSAGGYQVIIDNGISYNFMINPLPSNPNPAGMVLNSANQQLKEFVLENKTSYVDAITDIKLQPIDKNLINLFNVITDMNNVMTDIINTDLQNASSSLDSTSLDTIERLIIANSIDFIQLERVVTSRRQLQYTKRTNETPILSRFFGIKQAMANIDTSGSYPGNIWLDKRQPLKAVSKFNGALSNIANAATAAIFAVPGAALIPGLTPFVATLKAATSGISVAESILTIKIGSIASFDINVIPTNDAEVNISQVDNPGSLSIDTHKQIELDVSNIDNKCITLKSFAAPEFTISHELDIVDLFGTFVDFAPKTGNSNILKLGGYVKKAMNNLNKYAGLNIGGSNPKIYENEGPLKISFDRVEFGDYRDAYDHPKEAVTTNYLEHYGLLCKNTSFKYFGISIVDGSVNVDQTIPSYSNVYAKNTALCAARVDKDYRTTDEISAYVETDFHVHKNGLFSKISNNGEVAPKNAVLGDQPTDWACSEDSNTGLTWEVKTDNKNIKYTFDQANGYVQDINANKLCAANDWRLPTWDELVAFKESWFYQDFLYSIYRTSTPNPHLSGYESAVDFHPGAWSGGALSKYTPANVRLVRGRACETGQ